MDKSSSSPLRSLLTPLNSLGKFEGFVFLIVMVCLVAGGVGAVFGFIGFSEGDRFAAKFSALVTADANLQTGLVNERTMRTAADMTLMNEQAALQAAIDQEIATRQAQDAQLLALVTAEVAAREAAQAALQAQLASEVAARLANDTAFFNQVDNITTILQGLVAYNQWAEQQFLIKMDNLTHIQQRLDQQIAKRIADDTTIETQLAYQNAQTIVYIANFTTEVTTRQTQNAALIADLDALVGNSVFTINNFSALNHEFTFQASGPGYVITVSAPNIVNLAYTGVITMGGMTPTSVTRDIQFVAGNNVQITNNGPLHQFTIALINVPIAPNYQTSYGFITPIPSALIPPGSTSYLTPMGNAPYYFDLQWVGTFINAGSPPTSGWQIPQGYWQLRIKMIIGLFFSNVAATHFDPSSHLYTMGICQGSFAFCVFNPGSNSPVSAYGFLSINDARITLAVAAGYGLQQDAYLTATIYVDGNSATPGDSIYPVWQPTFSYLPAYGDSNTQDFVTSFMIEYEATRIG